MRRSALFWLLTAGVLLILVFFGTLDRGSIVWKGSQTGAAWFAGAKMGTPEKGALGLIHPSGAPARDDVATSSAMLSMKKEIEKRTTGSSFDAIGSTAEGESAIEEVPPAELEADSRRYPESFEEESIEDTESDSGLIIPVALLIRSVSSRTATIEWEGKEAGGGFNLYLCEDSITHWSNCESFDLDTNRAELEGLTPDSRYRLDIVSIDSEGRQSDTSQALYIETLSPGADRIDIPRFDTKDFIIVNGACYNDCANTYAIRADQGIRFDIAACSVKCEL